MRCCVQRPPPCGAGVTATYWIELTWIEQAAAGIKGGHLRNGAGSQRAVQGSELPAGRGPRISCLFETGSTEGLEDVLTSLSLLDNAATLQDVFTAFSQFYIKIQMEKYCLKFGPWEPGTCQWITAVNSVLDPGHS